MTFQDFLRDSKYYKPSELSGWLRDNLQSLESQLIRGNKKEYTYNIPASFDIETTSFYDADNQKAAIMYEWTFGIDSAVFIGRTWEEFEAFYNTLVEILRLDLNRRLLVYVHNLSFEFGFLQYRLEWDNVFSLDSRKPVYARTVHGLEFRCSYIQSGRSLATLDKELHTYEIHKLSGELDYKKLRHAKTRFTKSEILYCLADVKTVMAYIREQIEKEGKITKIPLTKTGYVRRYVRSCTNQAKGYAGWNYRELVKSLTIETDEYKLLKQAFQGGYTHGSPFYSGKILKNVSSFDFASSYPAVMCSELFPMSKGEKLDTVTMSQDEFERNLQYYCCIFEVEFTGIYSKFLFEDYISLSRCRMVRGSHAENGRLVSADYLITTVTELDFKLIRKLYNYESFRVRNFYRYRKAYLPKLFIQAILKLYADKTSLRDLPDFVQDYQLAKALLNACFGMCVTDPVRPEYTFTDKWDMTEPDVETVLNGEDGQSGYNHSFGRFLFYPWGVYVTAYARYNLWTAIYNLKADYLYSDTDSVKILHAENHKAYFEKYNDNIRKKLYRMCDKYRLSRDLVEPLTPQGDKKLLGIWDHDGEYQRFKYLGAKRYMIQKPSGTYSLTVSGLNKKVAMPYIEKRVRDPFNMFRDGMKIPGKYTGKNTHTYIDNIYDEDGKLIESGERSGVLRDYQGMECGYHELSGVHLEEAEYSLSISQEYIDYIMGVQYE